MPDINSVSVTFENGVKREEYGPTKKAAVTITAAVADGEDGGLVLDVLSQAALSKVAYLLGAPKPDTVVSQSIADANAGEKPPARKSRPPKDQFSGQVAESASETASSPAPAEAALPTDTQAGEDWSAAPATITDADLLQHTSAKAGVLGERERIKQLIGTFDPQSGQGTGAFKVQDIPAAQRQDYLDKLAALA